MAGGEWTIDILKKIGCSIAVAMLLSSGSIAAAPKDIDVQLDAEQLTTSPRAQDDFYLHVNYEWMKKTPIPAEETRVEAFSVLDNRARDRLDQITVEAVQHVKAGTANVDEKNIAALYGCIQDYSGREKAGLGKLAAPLQKIEQAATPQEYVETMMDLSQQLSFQGLISGFCVDREPLSNEKYTVWLNIPDTGLGKEYFANPRNADNVGHYQEYIAKMLNLYGRDAQTAEREAADILALQQDLAQHSLGIGELYDPQKSIHPLSLAEVRHLYGSLDTEAMLRRGGILDSVDHWYVSDPDAVRRSSQLLTKERLPVFKEYAIFKLLHDYSACLPKSYREAASHYKQYKGGAAAEKSLERQEQELDQSMLGLSYGRQYADHYFTDEDQRLVTDYVHRIQVVYRAKLAKIDWLENKTRQKAILKLDEMNLHVGKPEKWQPYIDTFDLKAPSEGGTLIDNVLSLQTQMRAYELELIGKPIDNALWWGILPQVVNAYYSSSDNSINFPAGILQAPFYDKAADDSTNLGGMGMLIAHEITHSFDSSGAQYDEKGRLRNWWSWKDWQAYKKRQQAIIRYYDRYRFPDGSHEDGEQTLTENIADLGALSCITTLAGTDREALRRMYTSYARAWSAKMTPAKFRDLLTDVHSLSVVRVNAVLSSIDEFYDAFDVQPGDRMYLEPQERVKLW